MIEQQDLAAIEAEGQRLIGLARRDADAVVPQYPTWTLRDLALHVAAVHGRTAEICQTLPQERIPTPQPPIGHDPFDWADEQLAAMLPNLKVEILEPVLCKGFPKEDDFKAAILEMTSNLGLAEEDVFFSESPEKI